MIKNNTVNISDDMTFNAKINKNINKKQTVYPLSELGAAVGASPW